MTDPEWIDLIDRLRAHPNETEWLEFKSNYISETDQIGEYISAISNAACICNKPAGYLIYGINDNSHDVEGTNFNPYSEKRKGNQDLIISLSTMLNPRIVFDVKAVDHPKGRVVVFQIQPASGIPVNFSGKAFIRIGTSKTDLAQHPEKARLIWMKGRDWSSEICADAKMEDLDPIAITKAREEFRVKHPKQVNELSGWDDITFLNKAKILKKGYVTNAALLLLGRPESASILSPAVAKISWILKDQNNKELDYEHFGPPFFLAGKRVLDRIRNLIVRAMPSGSLFPVELTQYDPWVIREALNNCIAHQDYGRHGRITVVEFPDRVILRNEGSFLPGELSTVIRQDAPQTIYRNPFLADTMVELNLIDTQGGGIKKMFETQRRRSFPMPDYDLSDPNMVSVCIIGRILDESYSKLLMARTDLSLDQVMLLDRVQKGMSISKEESQQLRSAGLIEGRFPSLIVSGSIAKTTGNAGRHIRERGFDTQYYLDVVMDLIRTHQPVARKEINEALVSKLPDRLTQDQKIKRVQNLLQKLRGMGKIENKGSRASPHWVISQGN